MARRQGTLWIGTISAEQEWNPCLPEGCVYLKGQLECGEGGFEHWQIFFILAAKQSIRGVCAIFAPILGHWELTRSALAEAYCWKEDTRIGDPFEYGSKPLRRNSATDWDQIKELAIAGRLAEVPSDIFVRYYRTLVSISADFSEPVATERSAKVFWGRTGSGKSRKAWEEAGDKA